MSDDTSSHVRVSHLYGELLLIFDIRALWRSGLSATAPECQKLNMVGQSGMALNPSNRSNLEQQASKELIIALKCCTCEKIALHLFGLVLYFIPPPSTGDGDISFLDCSSVRACVNVRVRASQ